MSFQTLSPLIPLDTKWLMAEKICADLQSIDCCMECFDIMLVVWNVP